MDMQSVMDTLQAPYTIAFTFVCALLSTSYLEGNRTGL